ncbi:MAG: metallophosphoesterase [Synechococcaceae cyanobacterium]|nr:metallophosphoesterase [Synechococcaceae cyanobacterium]
MAARIAGRTLPAALPSRLDKLVIFGDTGCRLLGRSIQACNDPNDWPLAAVVRALTRQRADLAIFLGDFFYREAPCPSANNAQCGGSPAPLVGVPFTDSGWGWVADALLPMAPLLESLPLLVLRGNHELCSRGANGYFLLFDPAVGTAERCAPSVSGTAPVVYSPRTAVEPAIRGDRRLRLVNVDSAHGSDASIDAGIAAHQRQPFQLMLSSHLHVVQGVQLPGQPGQIVLGNNGTQARSPRLPLASLRTLGHRHGGSGPCRRPAFWPPGCALARCWPSPARAGGASRCSIPTARRSPAADWRNGS